MKDEFVNTQELLIQGKVPVVVQKRHTGSLRRRVT